MGVPMETPGNRISMGHGLGSDISVTSPSKRIVTKLAEAELSRKEDERRARSAFMGTDSTPDHEGVKIRLYCSSRTCLLCYRKRNFVAGASECVLNSCRDPGYLWTYDALPYTQACLPCGRVGD